MLNPSQESDRTLAPALDTLKVPDWSRFPWLVHGFSTRTGGATTVYRPNEAAGELNLGFTTADDPENVRVNRELLLRTLVLTDPAATPSRPLPVSLVTLRQTHSAQVHRVDGTHLHGAGERPFLEGDGLMTNIPGVLLGIQTADCVPVLVVDPLRRAVAAFHAGWRGTVAAIVEQGVSRMVDEFGSRPSELLAAIGPAIGACCYSVGEEVLQQFRARFAYADDLFLTRTETNGDNAVPPANLHLDLAEANRRQLLSAGLSATAIFMPQACTSCGTKQFFSHRAERGVTGRMMAVIGIRRVGGAPEPGQ